MTLAAASRRIAVVVDGFIATAAALVAVELCPRVRSFLPVNSAILGQARESQTSSSLGWSDECVNHFVIQGCAQSVATSNGTSFRHDPSRGFPGTARLVVKWIMLGSSRSDNGSRIASMAS